MTAQFAMQTFLTVFTIRFPFRDIDKLLSWAISLRTVCLPNFIWKCYSHFFNNINLLLTLQEKRSGLFFKGILRTCRTDALWRHGYLLLTSKWKAFQFTYSFQHTLFGHYTFPIKLIALLPNSHSGLKVLHILTAPNHSTLVYNLLSLFSRGGYFQVQ